MKDRTGRITPQNSAGLNVSSAESRGAAAEWRRALNAGTVELADLFRERPACLRHRPLLDCVRLGRQWGTARAAELNARAIEADVNLAVSLGRAPQFVIDWLIRAVKTPDPVPREEPVSANGGGPTLRAKPFVDWINRSFETLDRQGLSAGETLAARIGKSVRCVHHYRNSQTTDGRPVDVYPLSLIEDVLDRVDMFVWDLYPDYDPDMETAERYCRKCSQRVTTGLDGVCPWCESVTRPLVGVL